VKKKKKMMFILESVELKLSEIHPSQPDDGSCSRSDDPISVFSDRGRWIIRHGNHRYYRDLDDKGPNSNARVKITSNPYIDY